MKNNKPIKVWLVDLEAVPSAPSVKCLTKEELIDVKPEFPFHKMNFINKHNTPFEVDREIAQLIGKKYPGMTKVVNMDEKSDREEMIMDEFSELTYNEIQRKAMRHMVEAKDVIGSKKEDVINLIIKKRKEGIIEMPEHEYKIYHAKLVEERNAIRAAKRQGKEKAKGYVQVIDEPKHKNKVESEIQL